MHQVISAALDYAGEILTAAIVAGIALIKRKYDLKKIKRQGTERYFSK